MPEAGADVHLTIDQNIQHFAERGMDHALAEFHCDAAWTIVEDVRTGQILAMACRPCYDPNAFPSSTDEQRRNRAIAVNYEPGSIFKTLTVAAAINEGLVASNTVFDCEMGRWTYLGKPLKDFHPYGELDVTGILRKSSNVGAAKIAVKVGERKLDSYLRAFGIGRKTGIELPGEEGGLLAPVNRWSGLDITRIAMGHTVAVTALQILNALCCMGNDGVLMQPYIVSKVVDANGSVLSEHRPRAVSRPITERTARQMREMLVSVTQPGGTGTRAAIDGYAIAGKTGSAEKLENGHYSKTKNMASFMGLIPADRPQIGIIVVLDNPHPLRTGGVSAAPVFRYIAEPIVHYLDIRPSDAEDTLRYVRTPGDEGWEPAPEEAVEMF
jgi:cell division protein FtsI (penicillin-binding protein 3)